MEKRYESIMDLLEKEIDKIIKKGDITPVELESLYKCVCVIEKIKMMEESGEEYSDGYSEAYGRYSMPYWNQYEGGRSRTSGRYMSRGRRGNGYSSHSIKDRMIDCLEKMMDEAGSEYERNTVSDWINRLEAEK